MPTLVSVIDILLVAILIYQLVLIVRGRRAAPVLFGIGLLAVVYVAAAALRLELLRTVLATLAPYTAFALIVMFQSELRRALSRLGRARMFNLAGRFESRDVIQDIVLAVTELAPNKIGALIVLERDIGLRTFVESGLKMDACVSRDLLISIFHKTTALHDGAVIIRRDRVAAAGCFLPLTMNPQSRSLGTRHRAAIGITEEADCIAVVVSEQTGRVSIAAYGRLEPDVTLERLQQRLVDHAKRRDPEPAEFTEGAETAVLQSEAPRGR
jgi:diadenylate cyclase